jgi:hypothetical protein
MPVEIVQPFPLVQSVFVLQILQKLLVQSKLVQSESELQAFNSHSPDDVLHSFLTSRASHSESETHALQAVPSQMA